MDTEQFKKEVNRIGSELMEELERGRLTQYERISLQIELLKIELEAEVVRQLEEIAEKLTVE